MVFIILIVKLDSNREFSKDPCNNQWKISVDSKRPDRSIRIVDLVDVAPNAVGTLLPQRNLAVARGNGKNVPEEEVGDVITVCTTRGVTAKVTNPLMDQDTRHTGEAKALTRTDDQFPAASSVQTITSPSWEHDAILSMQSEKLDAA